MAETGSFRLSFPALLSDSHSPQTVAERAGAGGFCTATQLFALQRVETGSGCAEGSRLPCPRLNNTDTT